MQILFLTNEINMLLLVGILGKGENMPRSKTLELLTYIIQGHPNISITSLMKLSYLVDLVSIKKGRGKITDFDYIRYNYGPFDKKIYKCFSELEKRGILKEGAELASSGDEFIVYHIAPTTELSFESLAEEEKGIVDEVLSSLEGFGTKALTELAYRTKPMRKIGAKLGNKVGLNKPLDLTA